MDGLGDRFHPLGKAPGIDLQVALGIAIFLHPAVVDGYRVVTACRQPGLYQRLRVGKNRLPGKTALVMSPVIPTQRWNRSQLLRTIRRSGKGGQCRGKDEGQQQGRKTTPCDLYENTVIAKRLQHRAPGSTRFS